MLVYKCGSFLCILYGSRGISTPLSCRLDRFYDHCCALSFDDALGLLALISSKYIHLSDKLNVDYYVFRYVSEERNYVIHPLYIIITLVLAGVTSLFIGFTVAYVYSRVQNGLPPVELPPLFFINTIFLVAASFLLVRTKRAYLDDETRMYKVFLWIVFGLTILFLIFQIIAWQQMLAMNISIAGSNLGSYLYVISGIHFLHVIAGIPFLGYFIYDARRRLVEPASVLVYLSDPDKKRRLTVLSVYWHFLDGLWIFLILFFLINRFI